MRVSIMSVDMAVLRKYQGSPMVSDFSYTQLNETARKILRDADFFIIYVGTECVILKDRRDFFEKKKSHSLDKVVAELSRWK